MSGDLHKLAAFLVEAKRRTYAGLDDDATVTDPLLRGSKQLEHRAGLLAAEIQMPYRRPTSFTIGELTYLNIAEGALDRFCGTERISQCGSTLFELRYSGGLLR